MPSFRITAMPTEVAGRMRAGGPDAYGLEPERKISEGGAMPCRHCLGHIAEGEEYLVFAYRPFPALQPYAETGPVFLHLRDCPRYEGGSMLPEVLLSSPDYIVRGYGGDDRIVYGTGGVTPRESVASRAAELLSRRDVAYLHVRSARNNCYQCRIERG